MPLTSMNWVGVVDAVGVTAVGAAAAVVAAACVAVTDVAVVDAVLLCIFLSLSVYDLFNIVC